MRRTTIVLAAAAAGIAALAAPGHAASSCTSSGPAAGSYTTTVCITAPTDGAILAGPNPATATVTFTGTPPSGIQRVIFSLDGQYLLTDYAAPYTFSLPTDRFVDGAHTLSAEALMRDGFSAQPASIALQFVNGVAVPPVNTRSFTPTAGTTASPGQPFVLAATGDGAGGEQSESDVVGLVKSWNPNLFLYLGDVYEKGSATEFSNWYAPAGRFGDLRSITDPTVGNHEYTSTANAAGYFDYWDNVPHYYSVDAGGWHIVSLDANGAYGQVAAGTAQYNWLAADLAANTLPCTLVYYHEPRWNIGQEGDTPSLQALWTLMAQDGVDVVLNGHDHTYQRWQPLDANGNPAPGGITEFVDGTGGHALGSFVRSSSRIAAQVAQFGALRLDLRPDGTDWQFQSSGGATLDSGALQCSGTPTDTTPPSAPASLAATSPAYNDVDLTWSPSSDDVGVAGYDVYRNGTKVASLGLVTSYSDRTVNPATAYDYTVIARDPAGNQSPASVDASVTTPMSVTQFSDDFESGTLAKWTTTSGLVVGTTQHFGGLYGAEAASTGSPAFGDATLKSPQSDLYYRTRFYVASQGANPLNLLKLKTATGGKLVTVLLGSTGKLSYRNDQTAITQLSTTIPTQGAWHRLELHVALNGGASKVEIWLDDVKVPDLGGTDSLGADPAGIVEIGDSGSGRTFDVFFDNVTALVSTPVDPTPPSAPGTLTAVVRNGPEVDLAWAAAGDNVGVTGYDVFRNGTLLASLGNVTSYADTTANPHSTPVYQVCARDLAGNVSTFGNGAAASVGPIATDSFESGTMFGWTSAVGVTPTTAQAFSGSWGAEAVSTGSSADAMLQLAAPRPELFYRIRFKVLSQGANSATLLRLRTAAGAAIASAFVSSSGKLGIRNDSAGTSTTSATAVPPGWHELQVHALVNDPSSRIDVWLDGVPVADLSAAAGLGTTPIGRVELGDSATGRSFDIAFDDVMVDTQQASESTPPSAPSGVTAFASAGFAVRVSWGASTDNVGVAAYTVSRDGTALATVPASSLTYTDVTAEPGRSYSYSVAAADAAGNISGAGGPAAVTTPQPVFADGFESGDLSRWTTASGFAVQQQVVYGGGWSGRATSGGAAAAAGESLATPQQEVFARVRFDAVSLGTTASLIRLKDAGGGTIASAFISSTTQIGFRNLTTNVATTSSVKAALGQWHTLVVHLLTGTSGQSEVWLDGTRIDALSVADGFGTSSVATFEVGDSTTGRTFDVAFDDAAIDPNRAADHSPPTAPTGLTATAPSGGEVDLTWTAANDDIGVAGYDVVRNGAKVGSVGGGSTSYADTAVASNTAYTYQVQARDAAGNLSPLSNTAVVTTRSLFVDDFETGGLSRWSNVSGLVVQQQQVYAGSWAARATSSGTGASAYRQFGTAQNELYVRLHFKVLSQGANSVGLLRFRTATGSAIGTVSLSSTGKLVFRDDVQAIATTSAATAATGAWHELEAHVIVGSSSLSEVWLDGVKVAALTRTDSLGGNAIGRIELGDPSSGRTFDVGFDDVTADTSLLEETIPPTAPTGLTATAVSGSEIDLAWTASTDNVGVDHYAIARDGSQVAVVPASSTSFADTGLQPASTHAYTVTAFDAAGNASPAGTPASATTLDTAPPSAPTGLTAHAVGGAEVDLSWTAATDNVGVTGYLVLRNGSQIASLGTVTSYADSSVAPATSYTYTVEAVDAAGNVSAPSAPASVGTSDTIAPTAPSGLTAAASAPTRVDLSWSPASDNVGVTGYLVFRGGTQIASLGTVTSYSDTGTLPATTATYTVVAFDAAGNRSPASTPASATTGGTAVFGDGFESGDLSQWSSALSTVAQQQEVFSGSWAARATSTGNGAYLNKKLPQTLSEVYALVRFKMISQGANNVTILKLRGSGSVEGVFLDSTGKLGLRNDVAAATSMSGVTVSSGWHTVLIHAVVGGSPLTEVWLDGTKLDALTRTDSLGTAAIASIDAGERSSGRTFDLALDDAVVDAP